MYGRHYGTQKIPADLAPLVEKYGEDAVRQQLKINEHEARKEQAREQRKSESAALREGLKAARDNPPIGFRMVVDSHEAPIRRYARKNEGAQNPEKRRADAFKVAAKLGLSIEERAQNGAAV